MDKIKNIKIGYIEAIRSQIDNLKELSKEGMYPNDIDWVIRHEKSLNGIDKYLNALEALYKKESEESKWEKKL